MKQHACLRLIGVLVCALGIQGAWCAPEGDAAIHQTAHDIFKQLIEINTTDSIGSTTIAAQAMAQAAARRRISRGRRDVLGPNERKGNMVARYRGKPGSKLRPMLIIGHLDVVEARREDWTTDPFEFVEKDGYYYGRGTQDMKDSDAIAVTDFIRLKKEGFVPDRDIILALTADEEGGTSNGVDWLLKNHRDLIDAEFALNPDSGGVATEHGKPLVGGVRGDRKALRRLSAARDQSGRPQLAAEAGQRHLPRRGRACGPAEVPVPVRAQHGHARVLHPDGGRVEPGPRWRRTCAPSWPTRPMRRPSPACPRTRSTTPPCARPASPP